MTWDQKAVVSPHSDLDGDTDTLGYIATAGLNFAFGDIGTIIDPNATGKEKMLASAFLFGKPLKAGDKIHDAYKGAHKSGNISKRNNNAKLEDGTGGWNLGENGGKIRGTNYSRHALERMAPNTPDVKAALTNRAVKKAKELGFKPQTKKYNKFIQKYVNPRNIPPSVIEDAIKNTRKIPGNRKGTFIHNAQDVKVVVNETGEVITVIPK